MTYQETPEERKERFKAMSSAERRVLIRAKMKAEGLEEGSGVKDATYDEDEVWELIQITSCFSDVKYIRKAKEIYEKIRMHRKSPRFNKKNTDFRITS